MIHYITTNGIGNAWVEAELEVLERHHVPFVLHTLRLPTRHFFGSAKAVSINANTRPIYPLSALSFLASSFIAPILFGDRFFAALGNALFGSRENVRARVVGLIHLFVAAHWARQLRSRSSHEPIALIHAQWIHSCGTVGMYGAWLLGIPFSFTGHAVDLFRDRVALHDKIRRAKFIVCISRFHYQFFLEHGARPDQLHIAYCGIDTHSFPYQRRTNTGRFRILSVGRLVEKKGLTSLIEACAILVKRGYNIECEIAGDGPLEPTLRTLIIEHNLGDYVSLSGKPVLQEDLPTFLANGNAFAQPCIWARDNDVDGTPRTLMEAMSSGLPSISARVAGIPDIIQDRITGLLIDPDISEQLADAIQSLIDDPSFADHIAHAGYDHIQAHFRLDACLDPLLLLFRQELHSSDTVAPTLSV